MENHILEEKRINLDQKPIDRIRDYIGQVGNPYCYYYNGIKVRISFSGKNKLEDCIKAVLLKNNEFLAEK